MAAIFTSLKFPERARQGELAVRCFLGGALRPGIADLSADALARLAHAQLASLLAIARRPLFARSIRFPRAMPQYEVGFPDRAQSIARRAAAHPGLVLAGTALGAVGLPDCITLGAAGRGSGLEPFGDVTVADTTPSAAAVTAC